VTDGDCRYYWDSIDAAVVECGLPSIHTLGYIPTWFLMPIGHILKYLGHIFGFISTLTPFVILMVTNHHFFNINKVCRDIGYRPIIAFDEGWLQTARINKERLGI